MGLVAHLPFLLRETERERVRETEKTHYPCIEANISRKEKKRVLRLLSLDSSGKVCLHISLEVYIICKTSLQRKALTMQVHGKSSFNSNLVGNQERIIY